jgi:Protein of unknown function (DUF1549)/Protein of unknown function (DUF1553)
MSSWLVMIGFLSLAGVSPGGVSSGGAASDPARDLAGHIDRQIAARLSEEHVAPAPRADDAELLRRLSLDLIGRTPTPAEVEAFLADKVSDKAPRQIDRLLADPQHATHFARLWRALLLPEAAADPRIAYFQPGFEAWLAERRRANVGFDAMVRELLTVPISRPEEPPQFVLRDLRKANPVAFLASKQVEPAKIATSCVRIFLGVRMECAQCHNHPFDRWTQRQFWSQAAFFAGLERKGRGPFAPLVEADRRTIRMNDTEKTVPAALLDGTPLAATAGKSPRFGFADWLTARRNPYFARAIVNRVWGELMGVGFVSPVDDFRESNAPSHPELLQEMADDFAGSGFDLTRLYRAICRSAAYQRTSARTDEGQARPELFAAMAIKPLSGDQFFDSLSQALAHQWSEQAGQMETGELDTMRQKVIKAFGADEESEHPKTSVSQALALMNGALVSEAVDPTTSPRLKQTLAAFPNSPERQIDALYLATLSRRPSEAERHLMLDHLGTVTGEQPRRLGDVLWVLLNSAEFRWNH